MIKWQLWNRIWVTWFGSGLVPIAPGTAGSIFALPVCVWMSQHSVMVRIMVAVIFTVVAIVGAGFDQTQRQNKDPSDVVIDEVAGMLWATCGIPFTPLWFGIAFLLFRVFDVVKPFPASWFDRQSKTAASPYWRGAHIVLDDVIAGLYVVGLLLLIRYYFSAL